MKRLSQRVIAWLLCLVLTLCITGCGCRTQTLEPLPEKIQSIFSGTNTGNTDPEPDDTQHPSVAEPMNQDTYPAFPDTISLQCGQAFAYNCSTGEVVGMKGQGETLYPASTTKLLTILTAMQYVPLDQKIKAGDELSLLAPDASVAYVYGGVVLTAEQMIEGMLLPSGNDAALALAAATGRIYADNASLSGTDAVDACVQAMNDYAASIGMTNSHFTNPDGYMDENHYTTVEDMMRLSAAAAGNDVIMKYCGRAYDEVTYVSGETQEWYNTNSMLNEGSEWYNPYVTGMKTGSFTGSYCLVATLEHDGQSYVVGVFSGADNNDRYGDVNTISDWLFGGSNA